MITKDSITQNVGIINKVEAFYLRILRWIAMLAATLLLAFAAWNGLISMYNYVQGLQSMEVEPVTVTADDIVLTATPRKADTAPITIESQSKKLPSTIYDAHAKKMYQIWKSEFEPYRPTTYPALTFTDFSDWYQTEYIDGTLRKHSVLDWVVDEDLAKADLEMSVEALSKAAKDPAVVARMRAFQTGKSNNQFWDRYDQTFMRLTDGFWVTLKIRRDAELARASSERAKLAQKSALASMSYERARNAFFAFLGLMFFFLIVAMERHQRRIAAELAELKASTRVE